MSISGFCLPKFYNHSRVELVSLDLTYKFLGQRDYIQGIVGLDGALRALSYLGVPGANAKAIIQRARVKREITKLSFVEAYEKTEGFRHPKWGHESVKVEVSAYGKVWIALMFEKEDEAVVARAPKDRSGNHVQERTITDSDDVEAKIGGITSFIDLVRAIEEVHRDAIIDEVNNARKVRWAYLEDMPILIDREARTIKSVVLRPQRNVCSPRGIFDIRRVELEGGSSFDMWFHYEI